DSAADSADTAATSTQHAARATKQAAHAAKTVDPRPASPESGYASATDTQETEAWAVRAPRPAEAATDVSER
ncbi:MAG: hypothetical protein ABW178_03430, partial [Pseudoxanthomonas sp.]